MFKILKNYVNKKANGRLVTVIDGQKITVFKQVFDQDDGSLLPDLEVALVTTVPEIQATIQELQQQRNILNNFLTAEGL